MDRMRRANVECWNFKLDFWPEKRSLYFSNFPLIGVIWASPTATDPSTKVSRDTNCFLTNLGKMVKID